MIELIAELFVIMGEAPRCPCGGELIAVEAFVGTGDHPALIARRTIDRKCSICGVELHIEARWPRNARNLPHNGNYDVSDTPREGA